MGCASSAAPHQKIAWRYYIFSTSARKKTVFLKNFWGKGGTCLKNELVLGEPEHPYQFLYIEFVVGVEKGCQN